MDRAAALMEVFDDVRCAFRKPKPTPAAASVTGAAPHLTLPGEDRDFPGVPEVPGIKHTAIARRMLEKGVATGEPDEFKLNAHRVFTIFSAKEKNVFGKLSVTIFRDIAKSCPPLLGRFEDATNDFYFTIPAAEGEGPGSVAMALRTFANATHGLVRSALCTRPTQRRRGGNLRASQTN